jgi:hypothetical protein
MNEILLINRKRFTKKSALKLLRERFPDYNVVAVLTNEKTGTSRIIPGKNIVTTAGDTYYAQKAAGETPTNSFGIMELGTAGNAPAKSSNRSDMTTKVSGSQKAIDTTYPRTNDPDPDNTGAGAAVVTRRVSYTTSEANASNIDRGIITNASPGANEPVLSYWVFAAPFTKTNQDTLKVFLNHTMNGV